MKRTAVTAEAFFDTNVLLYLLETDVKADRAESLAMDGGVISVQVLNEFAAVARRRGALDWNSVEHQLARFRDLFQVESLTPPMQARAMQIARAHRLGIYDANILAAAESAGCEIVWSEDMQDGFRVPGGPVVRNPFSAA